MLSITKFQLFPEFDTTQIYINGKVDINSKLEDTEEFITQVEKTLLTSLEESEMSSVTSVIGFKFNPDQSFELGGNLFQIFINLHERAPQNIFDRYINPVFSLEYDDSDMMRKHKAQELAKIIDKSVVKEFRDKKLPNGTPMFQEIDPKLLYEINKIGININQIAKRLNSEYILELEYLVDIQNKIDLMMRSKQ